MTATESASTQYPDALPVGTTLGEFAISKVIGVGGFGIVYMAHDAMLQRTVAIKEYLPITIAGRSGEQTVAVRSMLHHDSYTAGLHSFLREARLQARFSHPAMLEVYRVWEQNGTAYMAMRYYPGSSLRDLRVEAESAHLFDEASIKQIISPVMDALEELHSQSVLHRDVSPDNILMLPSGAPVLLDFGSARTVVAGAAQSLTTVLKPGYAPIEQYADDGTMVQGPWTDVYGLGAVLHYLAIGSPPPQAVSRMLGGTLSAFVAGASVRYSASFVAAVTAALAVKPQDRLQSVAALRDALGWVREQGGGHAQTVLQTMLVPHASSSPSTAASATLKDDEAKPITRDAAPAAPDNRAGDDAPTPALARASIAATAAPPAIEPKAHTTPSPEQPTAAAQRTGPRWLVIASLLVLTLGAVTYFAAMPPPSPALGGTKPTPPDPATSAPADSVKPPAMGTGDTNAAPPAATAAEPPPVARKAEKRAAPKSKAGDTPSSGPSASTRSRNPGETRQTSDVCERLFAKLSLGNAVLTETEQKQLPGCR